jgi:hypothetical protein
MLLLHAQIEEAGQVFNSISYDVQADGSVVLLGFERSNMITQAYVQSTNLLPVMRKGVFSHFGIKDSKKAVKCVYVFVQIRLSWEVLIHILLSTLQRGSNMTWTNCDLFTHKSSRSYLNHLVLYSRVQRILMPNNVPRKFVKSYRYAVTFQEVFRIFPHQD